MSSTGEETNAVKNYLTDLRSHFHKYLWAKMLCEQKWWKEKPCPTCLPTQQGRALRAQGRQCTWHSQPGAVRRGVGQHSTGTERRQHQPEGPQGWQDHTAAALAVGTGTDLLMNTWKPFSLGPRRRDGQCFPEGGSFRWETRVMARETPEAADWTPLLPHTGKAQGNSGYAGFTVSLFLWSK